MNEKLNLDAVDPTLPSASQHGQDHYVNRIVQVIGTYNKFFVDIGAGNGYGCSNTVFFRKTYRWKCVMFDKRYRNHAIGLYQRLLTVENTVSSFEEFHVPEKFDFLSIDIDGNDYWILKEVLSAYSPRIIQLEMNPNFEPHESLALKYDPNCPGRDTEKGFGASPLAFKKLGDRHGYTVVCRPKGSHDLILVKTDLLCEEDRNIPFESIYPCKTPIHSGKLSDYEWVEV
ncbi:MAG: FkbM family methyltransferase [bacterium]|nr:MAG: FkbM family methyltransferase [bacterium]